MTKLNTLLVYSLYILLNISMLYSCPSENDNKDQQPRVDQKRKQLPEDSATQNQSKRLKLNDNNRMERPQLNTAYFTPKVHKPSAIKLRYITDRRNATINHGRDPSRAFQPTNASCSHPDNEFIDESQHRENSQNNSVHTSQQNYLLHREIVELCDLPNELMMGIFNYLNLFTLFETTRVNKHTHNVCQNSFLLKDIVQREYPFHCRGFLTLTTQLNDQGKTIERYSLNIERIAEHRKLQKISLRTDGISPSVKGWTFLFDAERISRNHRYFYYEHLSLEGINNAIACGNYSFLETKIQELFGRKTDHTTRKFSKNLSSAQTMINQGSASKNIYCLRLLADAVRKGHSSYKKNEPLACAYDDILISLGNYEAAKRKRAGLKNGTYGYIKNQEKFKIFQDWFNKVEEDKNYIENLVNTEHTKYLLGVRVVHNSLSMNVQKDLSSLEDYKQFYFEMLPKVDIQFAQTVLAYFHLIGALDFQINVPEAHRIIKDCGLHFFTPKYDISDNLLELYEKEYARSLRVGD